MSRAGLWMSPDRASGEKPNGKQTNCTPFSHGWIWQPESNVSSAPERDDSQREGAAKKREQSDHYYVFT